MVECCVSPGRLCALRRRFDELGGDVGLGMIIVIGISLFVTGLAATAAVVVSNSMAQARNRVNFEQSLAAAESGVDLTLAALQQAFDFRGADFPVPNPLATDPGSLCDAPLVTAPDSLYSDHESVSGPTQDEADWANEQLDLLATNHPECVKGGPTGQYLILKPVNENVSNQVGHVYARGWAPSREAATSSRTIKVDYLFMPYKPSFAILTGSDLLLQSSSTDVMGAYGVEPRLAAVHTNGRLSTTGNPKVTGPVSVSVASPGGTSSGFTANVGGVPKLAPKVRIPRVSAEAFYRQAARVDAAAIGKWTDLCPDKTARAYAAGGVPCTGTVKGSSPFQGWSYNAGLNKWTAAKDTTSGTYYAHHADVANGNGNGSIPSITVIASATSTDCATKRYGNIVWDHYDTPAPAFKNLFFLADGDLSATSNFYSGSSSASGVVSGMYVAGEEVQVWTSSSGLVGAVQAGNQCPGPSGGSEESTSVVSANEVQGQIVKFDPDGDSPFSSLIATILWMEL